jgi:hypothetical protein
MSDETRILSTPHQQPQYLHSRQTRNAHDELATINHDDYPYDSTPVANNQR